jgi:hypothetical protein
VKNCARAHATRGWSLRRIAQHQHVLISAEMVRRILAVGEPVELPDDGDAGQS